MLSNFMILYGRRRFLLMVMPGFAFQWLLQLIVFNTNLITIEIDTLGFIMHGLIANEMYRQSIIPTILALTIVSIIVRLILIVLGRI
jgi:hypothetical protein